MDIDPCRPNDKLSLMREYAWEYFLAHGQARLATFRFYLVFCTILCAGLFMILANGKRPIMASPLAFILAFLSFVYWKVDLRHKQLIKNAQKALIAIEAEWLPPVNGEIHPACLFSHDAAFKVDLKQRPVLTRRTLTYSTCVGLVFLVFGIGGCVGGVVLLLWQLPSLVS